MNPDAIDSASLRIVKLRGRFAFWTLVYALAVTYASVIIGPLGFHFVPLDPSEALRTLAATRFVANGSDQRADWMANLVIAVPLGFLCMAALWTRRPGIRRWLMIALALALCLAFVIVVKFAQLFFPPRTVTLNYILAQAIGSSLGVALFLALQQWLFGPHTHAQIPGRSALSLVLHIYAAALVVYFLFPLDFVLSADDFRARVVSLPHWLLSLPGEGRPKGIRLALMLANIVETIPLGILLVIRGQRASVGQAAKTGFLLMVAVTASSALVMSATPHLAAIILRTFGIVLGAVVATQLNRVDPVAVRDSLARSVPYLVLPYVLAVLYVNGLLAVHWRTIGEAIAALDYRGLLPLWHYYIVSKTQAMASLVAHVMMFAPIGVMVSLRSGVRPNRAWLAAAIAFIFSLATELGRWMRPGLEPDFNDAVIAGASAWLAVRAMPGLWHMLDGLSSTLPLSGEGGIGHPRGRDQRARGILN